jgi:DNA repair protein RecO (recombination protein O)
MEWTADAFVLSARSHGETSAILDVFTREHGRYGGLVRGGNSRRLRPVLLAGNMVRANWRARLSEHLGYVTVEPSTAYAARWLSEPLELSAIQTLANLLLITPERQAYTRLFDTGQTVLENFNDIEIWPALFVRFEVALLEEMGFGLDLSKCAATGVVDNLNYVSPRSGCAVSDDAAEPYLDQLFRLPKFLKFTDADVTRQDVLDGFALTGHFLERRVYMMNGRTMPHIRERFLHLLERTEKA